MIQAEPGEEFVAESGDAEPNLVGAMGVSIQDDVGLIVLPRTTAGIVEGPPGTYKVTLQAPVVTGVFTVIWDTGGPDADSAFETLIVTPVFGGVVPWRPSVDHVARVVPAYTRGGFDDDRLGPSAGAERVRFTAETSPTATHVDGLITAACEEIIGRVGVPIPSARYGLARTAAVWHVAATISGGKVPADTDDANGENRRLSANYRASLEELVRLSRMGSTRLA